MTSWLLWTQLAYTLTLTGLIWYVQVVHYPLLATVGLDNFVDYYGEHRRRTTWVVAPLMLVEAAGALAWAFWFSGGGERVLVWLGAALVIAVWASTFGLQVPQHARLAEGFDRRAHAKLVRSNWLRTLFWTARGFLLLALAVLR